MIRVKFNTLCTVVSSFSSNFHSMNYSISPYSNSSSNIFPTNSFFLMCCHSNSIGFISEQYLGKKKRYKPWLSHFDDNCWNSRHRCIGPLSSAMNLIRPSSADYAAFFPHHLNIRFSIYSPNHPTINKAN